MLSNAILSVLVLLPIPLLGDGGDQSTVSPVEAALSPAATRIVGTLRGMNGRALDGIAVELQGRAEWYVRLPRGSQITESLVTDGEGRFESSLVLNPRLNYVFRWKGSGVHAGSSGWLTADDLGAPLTFEAVARRPLHVRLVQPDGSPVAGAEVRIRRSGESATTNQRGEVRLAHLAEMPEPVLVRDSTGCIHWALLEASDAWKDVVLNDGPERSVPQRLGAALTDETRAALVSKLRFEWLDAAIQADSYIDTRWRLLDVARIDLDAALQRLWSRSLDSMFRGASIRSFHDRSTCGVSTRYDSHVKEGVDLRRFVDAQLRLAADSDSVEARAAYDALVDGRPPSLLLRSRLGLLTRDFAHQRQDSKPTQLSAVELDSELKIIRAKNKPSVRYRELMALAVRALANSPSQAVKIVEEAEALAPFSNSSGNSSRQSRWQLQRVVYDLSATHLAEAERLARRYDWSGFSLGLLAIATARGVAPVPEKDRPREVERLLEAAYVHAKQESSRLYKDGALISLLAVAREVRSPDLARWVGNTLWWTAAVPNASPAEPLLAWTLRDVDPKLASALAFASVREVMTQSTFGNESWAVATWFDPERAAALALQEGEDGLEETANALERDASEVGLRSPVSIGFYWPGS